jgi:hypothetical protein
MDDQSPATGRSHPFILSIGVPAGSQVVIKGDKDRAIALLPTARPIICSNAQNLSRSG